MIKIKKFYEYNNSKIKEIFFRILASIQRKKILNENLTDYAYSQLDKAGLFDLDSDYEGMIGKVVMELIELFSNQGHSGFSASWVTDIFNKLSRFKPIVPIDNPMMLEEYRDCSEYMDISKGQFLQSTILSNMFSEDKGKSWYILLPKYNKDKDGNSFCTYYRKYIEKFPFKYEEYYD